jgi:hypothetical protein
MEPLYVTRPGGMRNFYLLLAAMLVLTVVVTVAMLVFGDTVPALVMGGLLVLTVVVIWVILPRRYELWPDHLSLVFPLWTWKIDYEGIQTVREAAPLESYAFIGVRFATAPSQAVTILRHRASLFSRPNLVISPADRAEFLQHLHRVMR